MIVLCIIHVYGRRNRILFKLSKLFTPFYHGLKKLISLLILMFGVSVSQNL